jgi:hypothetical protein
MELQIYIRMKLYNMYFISVALIFSKFAEVIFSVESLETCGLGETNVVQHTNLFYNFTCSFVSA